MILCSTLVAAHCCSKDASLLTNKGQGRHASFYMICSNHQQDLDTMGVCSCLLQIVHEPSPVYRWTAEKDGDE